MKRLLSIAKLSLVMLTAVSGLALAGAPAVSAQGTTDVLEVCNRGAAAGSATCAAKNNTTSNPLTGPNGILHKATQIIALMAGIASVIMVIIGGFRYVLSNGDAAAAASARKTIIYAAIGLVVSISAGTIIAFALSKI